MELSELAFLNAPIGLAILEDRVVRVANLRFAEMFGAPAEDFADTPLARVYPSAQDFERIGARGLEAMRESGRYEDERVMRRLDGDLFWCRVRGQSVTPDNPFRRGVWSFVDLSSERPVVELTPPREREIAILTCQGGRPRKRSGWSWVCPTARSKPIAPAFWKSSEPANCPSWWPSFPVCHCRRRLKSDQKPCTFEPPR